MQIKTINPATGESGPAEALSVHTPQGYIDLAITRSQAEDAPHVVLGTGLDSTVLGEKVISVVVQSGGQLLAESVLGTLPPKDE
jgi:hypothetical protein